MTVRHWTEARLVGVRNEPQQIVARKTLGFEERSPQPTLD